MLTCPLVEEEVYHIYTKSIAGYKIFNNESEYSRMKDIIQYYKIEKPDRKFSLHVENLNPSANSYNEIVQIISYCLMPTHIHLILKQLTETSISEFMRIILDAYSRYFNIKHKRKGPLWEGRFKRVLIKDDAQLLHLTRYVHLNPVTDYLVNKPEEWGYSSYKEYICNPIDKICKYDNILNISPCFYRDFVENRIEYQRELAMIKAILLDDLNYTS